MTGIRFALVAIVASRVLAQNNYGISAAAAPGPVYVTETVTDCDTEAPETMITVTNGVTVTYCPKCENMPHTTVYTTVYQSLCSSGDVWSTTPATYTVTETCDHPEPTWTPGPDHIPQGYTVTVHQCNQCATPGPVTITEPCGCEATEGVPSGPGPTSTPNNNGNNGSPPSGTGTPNNNGNNGSPPSGSNGNGSPPAGGSPPGSGDRVPGQATPGQGGSPPYPTPTTESQCAGPQCQTYPSGVPYSNSNGNGSTSNITPYEGAATLVSVFTFSSMVAVAIGVLAVLL